MALIGRPRVADEKRRVEPLTVLLTVKEARWVARIAKRQKKSLSSWCRDLMVEAVIAEQKRVEELQEAS